MLELLWTEGPQVYNWDRPQPPESTTVWIACKKTGITGLHDVETNLRVPSPHRSHPIHHCILFPLFEIPHKKNETAKTCSFSVQNDTHNSKNWKFNEISKKSSFEQSGNHCKQPWSRKPGIRGGQKR